MIKAPNKADAAPCHPAHQPATNASAAAMQICQHRTVRKGLLATISTIRGSRKSKLLIVLSFIILRQTAPSCSNDSRVSA